MQNCIFISYLFIYIHNNLNSFHINLSSYISVNLAIYPLSIYLFFIYLFILYLQLLYTTHQSYILSIFLSIDQATNQLIQFIYLSIRFRNMKITKTACFINIRKSSTINSPPPLLFLLPYYLLFIVIQSRILDFRILNIF